MSFNTELMTCASLDTQSRVKAFIDQKEGKKGLTRSFLETFILEIDPEVFVEVYRTVANEGIEDSIYGRYCLLGNKTGFYQRNRDTILEWAHSVFDIEKHESVYSMLAFDDYMRKHYFTYKQVKAFMEIKEGCPEGFKEYSTAMVLMLIENLCAEMVEVEQERINKESDEFISQFFDTDV